MRLRDFILPCLMAAFALPGAAQNPPPGDSDTGAEMGQKKSDEKVKDIDKEILEKIGPSDDGAKDPDKIGKKIDELKKEPTDGGAKTSEGLSPARPGVPPQGEIRLAPDRASRTRAAAPPPAAPQQAAEQAQRQDRAVTRARAMGESLRNTFTAQDLPTGSSLSPAQKPGTEAAISTQLGPGRTQPADPSAPKNKEDLMLASVSGFGGAFKAMGMRVDKGPSGAATILNSAGAPASGAELAALGERIRSEPQALMRRPDFFDVLPREHFVELKEDYQVRPALHETAFKDIDLTPEQRDFTRSASCQTMSGNCNPNTLEMSYRKGDMVAPEDLNLIYKSIKSAEDSEDSDELGLGEFTKEDDEAAEAAKRRAEFAQKMLYGGRFSLDSARKSLSGIFGGLFGDTPRDGGYAESGSQAAGSAKVWDWGSKTQARSDRSASPGGIAPARGLDVPADRKGRSWAWLILAAAGVLLLGLGARRLAKGDPTPRGPGEG